MYKDIWMQRSSKGLNCTWIFLRSKIINSIFFKKRVIEVSSFYLERVYNQPVFPFVTCPFCQVVLYLLVRLAV